MYSNRISTAARYDMIAADIKRNEDNFNRLTAQLASGKKLTSITDDPIAAVNIINTNRQLEQINTYDQNAQMGMKELDTLDDILDLANGYITQARDKAMQANNGTYGIPSLKALKTEIDEITKTVVDLANTEFNGNYIFGGTNTKISPYEFDENGNIIYNGTKYDNPDYVRKIEVAEGVFEVINVTGDKIFGSDDAYYLDTTNGKKYRATVDKETGGTVYKDINGNAYAGDINDLTYKEEKSGVFNALKVLSDSIQAVIDAKEAGDPTAEDAAYETMRSTLDGFKNSQDAILTEQTKFGGVYNRLEMTESSLETNSANLTSYLSSLQEIDFAEAASKWLQAQYAYQASMQVAASSMNMSLLNYM